MASAWTPIERSVTARRDHDDPHAVGVTARFEHTSGEQYEVPALVLRRCLDTVARQCQ